MGKMLHCAITGADDSVEPGKLFELGDRHPVVEWAILYSPKRMGSPRYPSREWLNEFFRLCLRSRAKRALHICGKGVTEFAEREPLLLTRLLFFQRAQLNFSVGKLETTIRQLAETARTLPVEVITQHNAGNAGVAEEFRRWLAAGSEPRCTHSVLFDASGGGGISPTSWPPPLPGFVCGYAGGLDPDNLAACLDAIEPLVGDIPFWVDMETGVRSGDRFDLEKVGEVLDIVRRRTA